MVTLFRVSKSRPEEGGFILLALIIFVLVTGIALVGFFIFGQQKTSGTFVKANNPSQSSLTPTPPKTYQPADLMKEKSRGSSYRQTNIEQTTSSPARPSSVNPTSASVQNQQTPAPTAAANPTPIPDERDSSPTTFN